MEQEFVSFKSSNSASRRVVHTACKDKIFRDAGEILKPIHCFLSSNYGHAPSLSSEMDWLFQEFEVFWMFVSIGDSTAFCTYYSVGLIFVVLHLNVIRANSRQFSRVIILNKSRMPCKEIGVPQSNQI